VDHIEDRFASNFYESDPSGKAALGTVMMRKANRSPCRLNPTVQIHIDFCGGSTFASRSWGKRTNCALAGAGVT
jgi:hypothetical protein